MSTEFKGDAPQEQTSFYGNHCATLCRLNPHTQVVKIQLIAEQWDLTAHHLKGQTCSYILSTKDLEALRNCLLSIPLLACFAVSRPSGHPGSFFRHGCCIRFTQCLLIGPAGHIIAVSFHLPISRWGYLFGRLGRCHWGCHFGRPGLYLDSSSSRVGCHFGRLFATTTFQKTMLSLYCLGLHSGFSFICQTLQYTIKAGALAECA